MPPLSVMFKTVSTDCNLDCSYCYYRASLEGARSRRRIEPAVLETFIPQYLRYVADAGVASFAWQGGEPTLAGKAFFRQALDLQARHALPGTIISNAIQTNATLIDQEWAELFAAYRFLVGVSIDGPPEVHDLERKDRGGHGSFRNVMASLDHIRRHGVEFNVLCVVGPHNVGRPGELLRFFRREGITHMQFIPAMGFQATDPYQQPTYLVTPEEYGEFLAGLFDEWYEQGAPAVSVRTFDNHLQSLLGIPNDSCVQSSRCDAGIVVEYNGDVYPCDFYIHPDWLLGNVLREELSSICESPRRREFVMQKEPLAAECAACEFLLLCRSGCPRNQPRLSGGARRPEYFCASYRHFFAHASERLAMLGDRLARRSRYRERTRPGVGGRQPKPDRNDPCPCGNGQKFKKCCGDPAFERSYLAQ